MAKSKEEIYQQGLIDLGKGSFSGSASMPSEIGQLALPGFFSNLFSLKSKGLKPDKEPTLLDPKDRYAYQLKKAFPEKDAKYKVKGNFEDVAHSVGLNPDSAEAGFGSLLSMDPISGAAKTAITLPKGIAELMPVMIGILGGRKAFKGTKYSKLLDVKLETAKKMEKAGHSKDEIKAVTDLVELPDGRWVMWADHESADTFSKSIPGYKGKIRSQSANVNTWESTLGDVLGGEDSDIRQLLRNMELDNLPVEINPGLSQGMHGATYFRATDKGMNPLKISVKYRNPELLLGELHDTRNQQLKYIEAHQSALDGLDRKDPDVSGIKKQITYRKKYVNSLNQMIEQAEAGKDVDMPYPQVDMMSQTNPRTSKQASDTLVHEATHAMMGKMDGETGAHYEDMVPIVSELQRLFKKKPGEMTSEELEKFQHPAVQNLISKVGQSEIMDPDLAYFELYRQAFGEGLARASGRKFTDPSKTMNELLAEELPYGGVSNQQIKEAADVLGIPYFGTDNPLSIERSLLTEGANPIFESPVFRVLDEIDKDNLNFKQWKSQLSGRGVPKDDFYWTGLEDWMRKQKGPIRKSDIEDYMRNNQISIEEVQLTSPDTKLEEIDAFQHVTPGGENYRELVLNWKRPTQPVDWNKPLKVITNDGMEIMKYGKHYEFPVDEDELREEVIRWAMESDDGPGGKLLRSRAKKIFKFDPVESGYTGSVRPGVDLKKEMPKDYRIVNEGSEPDLFLGSHYDDQDNLMHIRINERVGVDGKKVLFVDEIQSDWGQAGHEKGFREFGDLDTMDWNTDEMRKLEKEATEKYEGNIDKLPPEKKKELEERQDLSRKLRKRQPEGPFVQSTKGGGHWSDLAVKRVVKWAADNGFERIAWTTGKQQNKRSKKPLDHKGMIGFYDDILVKRFNSIGERFGTKVTKTKVPGRKESFLEKNSGSEEGMWEIDENIGSPGFTAFLDGEEVQRGFKTREEGMEWLINLNKKMIKIPPTFPEVWSMDLTPELIESTKKGLPYFSKTNQEPTGLKPKTGLLV